MTDEASADDAEPHTERRKPERRQCGSLGCILLDQHKGLCQIVLGAGPRQRRPALKLVEAVAGAPCRSPRGSASRARAEPPAPPAPAPAPAPAEDPPANVDELPVGAGAAVLSDSELVALPCVKGFPPAVIEASLALFRQWCPADADASDVESEAGDAIAHLEWAERSLTREELVCLTRALESEARRRLGRQPTYGADRTASPSSESAGEGTGGEAQSESAPLHLLAAEYSDVARARQRAAQRSARPDDARMPVSPPPLLRHSYRANQAAVGARVVVVYEEGSAEEGGVRRVPYGGIVRQVHRQQGMLVQFDEDGEEAQGTGESVWVSERVGDEWWYEPGHEPASTSVAASGRSAARGRGARAEGRSGTATSLTSSGSRQAAAVHMRRGTPPAEAPAPTAPKVDQAFEFMASSKADALLARLEARLSSGS